jgi:hypothetical protein
MIAEIEARRHARRAAPETTGRFITGAAATSVTG